MLFLIIYLIIKILIIDWSKVYHVTRRKSIYHCLEGLGVLSFDLMIVPPNPLIERVTPPRLLSLLRHNGCNVVLRYAHWFYFASSPFSAPL